MLICIGRRTKAVTVGFREERNGVVSFQSQGDGWIETKLLKGAGEEERDGSGPIRPFLVLP